MDLRTAFKGSLTLACALTVSDAGAESATLEWDRAASHTNLSAFVLKWGTRSGEYSQFLEVDPSLTTATVNNLIRGQRYFFVVTARNIAELESDPSNEVSYTPSLPPVTMQIQNTLLSTLIVTVTGTPGQAITVESADSPDSTQWSVVYTGNLDARGEATYVHASNSSDRRFFRARHLVIAHK